MVKKGNLKNLLNLHIADLLNRCDLTSDLNLPIIESDIQKEFDYIATHRLKNEYNYPNDYLLSFYEYDYLFDGKNGLFNFIYNNDKTELQRLRNKFKYIKYAIVPDITVSGDMPTYEQISRIGRALVVACCFKYECDIDVIPNFTYSSENLLPMYISYMKNTQTIAMNLVGVYKENKEKVLLEKAIKYAVDNLLNLKYIIVYTCSLNNRKLEKTFKYALDMGIRVSFPNNHLKSRQLYLRIKNKQE